MGASVAHGLVTASRRASLAKVTAAAAGGYPLGARSPLVSVGRNTAEACSQPDPGPLANCDVWISAPASWSDVEFRLLGRVGEAWAELDVLTSIADAEHIKPTSSGTTGLLFQWRGNPCDEYAVEGFHTTSDHAGAAEQAFMTARAWGLGTAREVVSPYAPLRRERHAVVTVGIGLRAGLLSAPSSGRALYVTSLEVWSDAVAAADRADIETGTGTVLRDWQLAIGATTVQTFPKPLRLPPGESLVGHAGAGNCTFNVSAFED